MHVDCRIVSLVLCGSELNSNNGKAFGLNETNFREELKGFINIMAHSEVDWGIGLVDELKTIIS